jgi:hypothetical protein
VVDQFQESVFEDRGAAVACNAKRAWVRPAVHQMRAGAAEEGGGTVTDFGDSES